MGPRRSSTRTRRPVRGGGFTFVEMVALMVLVSILAAAAVAQLDRLEDSQADIDQIGQKVRQASAGMHDDRKAGVIVRLPSALQAR